MFTTQPGDRVRTPRGDVGTVLERALCEPLAFVVRLDNGWMAGWFAADLTPAES